MHHNRIRNATMSDLVCRGIPTRGGIYYCPLQLLPATNNLLKNPAGEQHPLIQQGHLHMSAWRIWGNRTLQHQYPHQLPPLLSNQEDLALEAITQVPGRSGKAGVSNGKLVPLDVI